MQRVRLLIYVAVCMIFVLGLTACGAKASETGAVNSALNDDGLNESITADVAEPEKSEITSTEVDAENDVNSEALEQNGAVSGKDTLVVVFSATGTTKGVAEKIAAITDADLYEIVPADPYSDADLNWNDNNSRTTKEQNDSSARPAIGSEAISLEGYKTIYIGYPIWWGEEPRIMDTFVESYNFDGITMIPFCTSGGSGIGRSGKNLAEHAGSGNWLDGDRLQGSASEADIQSWIDGLQ
ncbi:MAG: flavodoxin [Lachnospiraceae bacterium]|nr:flavodoxin [Lachnospiraceae bacterium]